jgi:hypothetical protein
VTGRPAGDASSCGGCAQNQLPGGHELASGADWALAAAGIADTMAHAAAERMVFVMARHSLRESREAIAAALPDVGGPAGSLSPIASATEVPRSLKPAARKINASAVAALGAVDVCSRSDR